MTSVKKTINKHIFVWIGAFAFGSLGLDRFLRGQISTGVCKLIFGWFTLGIWPLVDFLIAAVKAYDGTYPGNTIQFVDGEYTK